MTKNIWKKIRTAATMLLLSALPLLTSCSDSDDNGGISQSYDEQVVKVDVILPESVWDSWLNVINWAQQNIAAAQVGNSKRVKLDLNWIDEDNTDLDKYGYGLSSMTSEDTVHVVIGPYSSTKARTVINYCSQYKIPIILPTASSAELQRIQAKNSYVWFLTESDVTQCDMMMLMANRFSAKNVGLYYSDDAYGQSFKDWFGYQATELGLNIIGINTYSASDNLSGKLRSDISQNPDSTIFFFAISSEDACITAGKQINEVRNSLSTETVRFIMSDVAFSSKVASSLGTMYGITASASPYSGFSNLYELRFGTKPYIGEAHIYDALTMIACGAVAQAYGNIPVIDSKTGNPQLLNDQMLALSCADGKGTPSDWTEQGLRKSMASLAAGGYPDLDGASGSLSFDATSHTKILETIYEYYGVSGGKAYPVQYMSTSGLQGSTASESVWNWNSQLSQVFSDADVQEPMLPALDKRWALVISPSTSWANYRHQADAFAMCSMLLEQGYDRDHIVLIVEDNLAYDSHNSAYPGKIFIEDNLESEVRGDITPDYKFTDMNIDDIRAILNGEKSDRLPKVIESDEDDNILFFWSGHGASGRGLVWGDESAYDYYTGERMKEAVQQMQDSSRYRRMMLAIETCFSGLIGKALEGIPNVIAITAANPYETSKADVHSTKNGLDLGVYLSNAFARTFRKDIKANTNITIHDLWYDLAKSTTGSHVTIYNYEKYGSVNKNTMSEYFGK